MITPALAVPTAVATVAADIAAERPGLGGARDGGEREEGEENEAGHGTPYPLLQPIEPMPMLLWLQGERYANVTLECKNVRGCIS